jgi:anti-sigma factor RsiW
MRLFGVGQVPQTEHLYANAQETAVISYLMDKDELRRDVWHWNALSDQFRLSLAVSLERQVPHRNLVLGFRV